MKDTRAANKKYLIENEHYPITEYLIAAEDSIPELEIKVMWLLASGMVPLGGGFIDRHGNYCQAMIAKRRINPENDKV